MTKLMLLFCAAILISISAVALGQAQPVVRDHRGQPQQKAPPATPGSGLTGTTICTPVGVIITSACSTIGPKVRDHRKKK